jgi:hypothetical protein
LFGLLCEGCAEAEEANEAGDFGLDQHIIIIALTGEIRELILFYCK